jgi:murein DD-endopeptidase MepM/ murein hydrolase activator NlpD
MIARRSLLTAGAVCVLFPIAVQADESALRKNAIVRVIGLRGPPEQGSLVVCTTEPGASASVDGNTVRVSPEGIFVFGIPFDQIRSANILVHSPDGTENPMVIRPVVRQYETQAINGLPEQYVTPMPEERARIEREAAMIHEARKRDTAGVGFAEPLDWPFPGIITGVYGSQRILDGKPMAPHLGIDIAAPEGTPIHAAADAVVSISDDYFLDGGFTLLDHGHGVSTCYLHQSKRMVATGDKVGRGDVIGLVGRTGRATGPHTHWGLCWFQVKLDPSRSTTTLEPPKE